jgi:carbon-monoxide dehydrogenase large subunit
MMGGVKRVDDPKLLRGSGRFVGDIRLPGQLEAAFLRSPHAHARVLRVNVRAAADATGVLTVLTGADAIRQAQPIRAYLKVPGFKGSALPCLATDAVRFVGQPIAAVVAQNRQLAEDAVELIEVDFETLPAVVDARGSLEPGAPLLFEEWGDNVHAESSFSAGDVDGAFANADLVFTHHFHTGRYTGVPIENRAVLAHYEFGTGDLTVWSSTQVPHLLRTELADVLDFPEHRVRVIAPDVGGGFGIKAVVYPEEIAVALLSVRLCRPVRWLEDRLEHLQSAIHARQQDLIVEAAADRDGNVLGVRFDLVGDVGAYSAYPFTSAIETLQTARHLPGPYRLPAYAHRTRAAVTNKSMVGPCRAVSRPVGSLVMETIMDVVAERTGLDAAEVRRRNLVQPGQLPYTSITNQVYDSGSYVESLDKVLDMVGYAGFREEQARARKEGRYLGIGMGLYVEQTAQGSASYNSRGMDNLAGYDSATVRIDPSGKVSVAVGVSDHGQSHHTTLAQVAAQQLGVPLEDVTVVHGDTARTPYGMGTFTSRSAVCGAGAIVAAADRLRDKISRIAGHVLEVAPEDIDVQTGEAVVKGAPERRLSLREIARMAYLNVAKLPPGMDPELEASGHYDAGGGTYSNGAHAAVVEVDPETGQFQFLRYCVVEDCGTIINQVVVDGQIHGGVAQGVAGAAYEELVYSEDGQLLTTTFMDYLMPTSVEVPHIDIAHLVSPSPFTPLGIKGMGEGGTVSPGSVLAGAIADALRPFGIRFMELPITPEKIVAAVRKANGDRQR